MSRVPTVRSTDTGRPVAEDGDDGGPCGKQLSSELQSIKTLTHDARNVACAVLIVFEMIELDAKLQEDTADVLTEATKSVHTLLDMVQQLSDTAARLASIAYAPPAQNQQQG